MRVQILMQEPFRFPEFFQPKVMGSTVDLDTSNLQAQDDSGWAHVECNTSMLVSSYAFTQHSLKSWDNTNQRLATMYKGASE